ncbi:MAG: MoxR family ATPase [Bacteroidales bacterium]|nr:MoxR family ATPase [Bacteroidales bacterium]MBN2755697.1 MoxR family ATPase [Bacteroidales bacterium]
MEEKIFVNRINLDDLKSSIDLLKAEIEKVIVGQEKMIDYMLVAILSNGHVLLEGVPGIAKTLAAKLTAKTIDSEFSRVQFTPDLMPSDILGTSIFNIKNSEFEFKKGPVFTNILLIDEINRSPAKTQSALFEVMEERQITVDGNTYIMNAPFIVFATQNPIEQEGTYKLPEAQLDRFIFKIEIDYPSFEEEIKIIDKHNNQNDLTELNNIEKILSKEKIIEYQKLIKDIHIEENLIKYIAEIVIKTRNNNSLFLGASPRASIAILNSSKAYAAINGRDFVKPEDIKEMVYPVLNHRIVLTPEKEIEGISTQKVIRQIIESVEIPR